MSSSHPFTILSLGLLLLSPQSGAGDERDPVKGFAVPTFYCLGLYWSPPGGSSEREVRVKFRALGETAWRAGYPMRYNPIADTDLDLADYRGSLVHLTPGTTWQVKLTLEGTNTVTGVTATTWSETFPIGETVKMADSGSTLAITQSGKPDAWRVYDGSGSTIDVSHQHDHCITIDASYVILRGFTLKGAGDTSKRPRTPAGAIHILGGHDIVIEDCDISGWGRTNPETGFGFNYDSAIYSNSATLERLVIQRCKLHHPATDSNHWAEPKKPTHPNGPQAISLFNSAGNNVIRHNECYSDLDHMFNDTIGGGNNGNYTGAPGADSDIHGNLVSHAWDDGIEAEGGGRNVRIWGNYITQCFVMIGNAPVRVGPMHIWGNVVERCEGGLGPGTVGLNFLKMGSAGSTDRMTGYQYIFHNTLFGDPQWLPKGGIGGYRDVKHTISRNNILQVLAPAEKSVSAYRENINNSFDYDLFNGTVPDDHEKHGVKGVPVYQTGAGFDPQTLTGRFQLAPNSPGAGAGEALPNFSQGFTGKAPDIGAHQRGTHPMRFGVKAGAAAR